MNDILWFNHILTLYEGWEINGFTFVAKLSKSPLRCSKRTDASKLAKSLGLSLKDVEYVY